MAHRIKGDVRSSRDLQTKIEEDLRGSAPRAPAPAFSQSVTFLDSVDLERSTTFYRDALDLLMLRGEFVRFDNAAYMSSVAPGQMNFPSIPFH